jgi:peptide/nickel transport system substrate-binding protein
MKIKTVKAVLLGLLLPALVAPLSAGRVVRSGSLREPQSIDPARSWDDTSSFYVGNIFDTLVSLDPQSLRIEPSLAVSWETSQDGLTWTFNLRKGVRFQDGTPFDADAVVFTFSRQMDPGNPNRVSDFPLFNEIFNYLKAVRRIGPYQVQFTLSEPFFPFLPSLTADCAAIVSPTAVRRTGAAFARQPVGTGPYKLTSWQKDKRLVLAANRDYWRGKPLIDEYIDTIDPRVEMLINLFQEGSVDIIYAYSISKMASYRKQDWVQIVTAPYLSVTYAVLNSARPGLRSKEVRQALCHAWDPRAVKLMFQDYVLPIHSLLPRAMNGDAAEEAPLGYSLAKAQALLKRAGGGELQLEMLLPKDEGLMFQLFSMFAKTLKQLNVKLKLTRLDAAAYAQRIAQGDFDLSYSGWIADYPDPDSILFPLMSERLRKQGFANISGSRRADLSSMLIQARREGDAKKRLALYRTINRAMISDGLVLPIYQDKRVILVNRKLGGVMPNPLGRIFIYDFRMK